MKLKNELLIKLNQNPNSYLSGEALAKEFNVSRTAIWKAIRSLQNSGYEIESTPKGYRYFANNDLLHENLIRSYATDITYHLLVFETIDSTNNYAKTIASNPDAHGTLVVANHQTAGRGRRGHTFYSPGDTGLYLTLILKPTSKIQELLKMTIAAAVASVEAIQENSSTKPQIKWVNDIFIDKKKIAGILTEAISDFETGDVEAIIIGIGINTKKTTLPDDIKDIAGAINDEHLSRNKLAASLWQKLLYWTSHLDSPELIAKYREYSLLLNHLITYERNGELYTGTVKAINEEGNLVIETDNKETVILTSGEVSVKDW